MNESTIKDYGRITTAPGRHSNMDIECYMEETSKGAFAPFYFYIVYDQNNKPLPPPLGALPRCT